MPLSQVAAIVLAGGRSARLGGADKTRLTVGGRTLLDRTLDAVAPCAPIIVAGEPQPGETWRAAVRWVREHPAHGGPVAAIAASIAALGEEPAWTLVLTADLPGAGDAVTRLLRDSALVPETTAGLCLADASGRPQWLTALYRTGELRRAVTALGDGVHGASMRALLDDLAIGVVSAPEHETRDVDTWEDLRWARHTWGDSPTVPDPPIERESP